MAEPSPAVICACGHSFTPDAASVPVCPRCGKPVPAPPPLLRVAKTATTPVTARRGGGPRPEAPLPAPIKGYTFVKRLGSGGMGDVYLARQESLDRLVAMKLLPPELAKDKAYVEGFMREARSAGRVTHENIMGAVDVGESEGRYYFVMEYVSGETLHQVIKKNRVLAEKQALEITRQVARGLRHANLQNLIHRDIKPKNILITPEGVAKLCDFGLATSVKASDAQASEDEENVHTTPAYASPEQCRADALDHRSDIYSLGVSLFEMLTGKRPFNAPTSRELMTQQVTAAPPDPRSLNPQISEGASELVLRMIRKRKEERPATYDELLKAVDALLGPRADKPAAPAATGSSNRGLYIGAGAAAVVLVGVLALVLGGGSKPPPEPAPKPAPVARKTPSAEAEVKRQLEEVRGVQREAQGKPGDYDLVRARWKELEERFAGTPHQAVFAAARMDFEKAVAQEAAALAKDLMGDAEAHLQAGRPVEALAALKKFPVELSATPAGTQVAQKALLAERAIDDRFRDGFQRASQLASLEKFAEARREAQATHAALGLDGPAGEARPQMRRQIEEFLKGLSNLESAVAAKAKAAAEAATAKKPDPTAKTSPDPAKPAPLVPEPAEPPVPGTRLPGLGKKGLAHFMVLRTASERADPEKRAATAAWFAGMQSPPHKAIATFLAKDDTAWKLRPPTTAALEEYFSHPALMAAPPMEAASHQALLDFLVQKIAAAGQDPLDALHYFMAAHLEALTAAKTKVDPAVLLQARFGKGPATELWGPAGSIARIEMAGLLAHPPGTGLARAAEAASLSPDFGTRLLGALCVVKDAVFDAAAATDRWKKLAASTTDPAWIRVCDAVIERIKAETTCEFCLGQGRYACTACVGLGVLVCGPCRGNGKITDPSEGTLLTCTACKGRRTVDCAPCQRAKAVKCLACDGKKMRSQIVGSHFRIYSDLGLCRPCKGTGSLFSGVAFPCSACDGYGRTAAEVPADFSKLPAWTTKGREGRMLWYALRWLARHASPDGLWHSGGWTQVCPEAGCRPVPGYLFDVGLTSLTLMAFFNAGIGPDSDVELGGVRAGPLVKQALQALVSCQAADGLISRGATLKPVFEDLLATTTLFTALQLAPVSAGWTESDRASIREAALKGLRWALTTQAKGGGWGYTPGATSDTWVTSWGALALLSAREAGVEIPKINLGYILAWYDSVTDKKDAHLGYTPQQMGRVNLSGNENYQHHDTLTAFGSLARMQIEGRPSNSYAMADKLLERDLPNPDPLRRDYCYWYFGTLFTAQREQRKGAGWSTWTQALGRELVSLQEATDNCSMGSFSPQERWTAMGGKVYTAAMNALTLTQILATRPAPAPLPKK